MKSESNIVRQESVAELPFNGLTIASSSGRTSLSLR
jgi:hypothetical protein